MPAKRRRWIVAICAAMIAAMGCNPLISLVYLFNNDDPKRPPEFPLKASKTHKRGQEVKVLVLTHCVSGLEEVGIDQMLAMRFGPVLEERYKDDRNPVRILRSEALRKYKSENPNWHTQHPMDIGKHFGADFVIELEIIDARIYEPESHRRLMRGRAQIDVKAYDLSKPTDAVFQFEFTPVYPATHEVDRSDMSPSMFRENFVKSMAKELANKFSPHTSSEAVRVDR